MARFQVEEEGRPTRNYRLITEAIIIGRVDTADLVLPDTGVSRKHALVERVRDGWVIRDNESANGTSVNGAGVEAHELQHGDVVTIGKFALTFLTDDEHDLPEYTDPSAGEGDYATNPGVPLADLATLRPAATAPEDAPTAQPAAAPAPVAAPSLGAPTLEAADGTRFPVGARLVLGKDVPVSGVLPFGSAGMVEASGDGAVAKKGSFLIPLYVNGASVNSRRLVDGDEVRVGSTTLTYRGA